MENERKLPHTIEIKLESVYHTLKNAEKKAADYMLDYPEQITEETIGEAALRAGCSEATFVRLAKKLGYSGYLQLKQACSEIYRRDEPEENRIYDDIRSQDSCSMVIQKVFLAAIQALEDTRRLIDDSRYKNSLNAVIKARRILALGAGDAYIAAYLAYLKFSRIGMDVICPSDYDVQLLEASKLNEQDVVLLISHSGNTKTLYQAAQTAKKKGVFLIAVTNYPLSPIAKIADEMILTAAFMKNPHNETMAKRIPELCVIESMYINIQKEKEETCGRYLKEVNRELKKNKLF